MCHIFALSKSVIFLGLSVHDTHLLSPPTIRACTVVQI